MSRATRIANIIIATLEGALMISRLEGAGLQFVMPAETLESMLMNFGSLTASCVGTDPSFMIEFVFESRRQNEDGSLLCFRLLRDETRQPSSSA